jgi:hypothetical protein
MLGNGPEISGARRKKGNFANSYRGPDSRENQGLDWDKIRREYHDRVMRAVEAGVDNPETRLWKKHGLMDMEFDQRDEILKREALARAGSPPLRGSSLTPEDRARGGRKRSSGLDTDRMVELYEQGLKPNDIALKMGHAPETIRNHLKRRGVYDRSRFRQGFTGTAGPGPQQLAVCSRGHDLTEEGATKQLWKTTANGPVKNGRACVRCWGGPAS